jgi:hypothetical protein
MIMYARTMLVFAGLLAVSASTHAETDIHAPYPITAKKSGLVKETAYMEARKEALAGCDRDGGFIDTMSFDYLEGWGAAEGTHYVVANATCRIHP